MDTSKLNLNWGGEGYAAYDAHLSTTTTPAASATSGGAPPVTPPGTGATAATTSADKTASPAGDRAGASSSPTHDDANIKQLREGYDKWKSLGEYDAVSKSHGAYSKLFDEANTLAKQLNYDSKELAAAFDHDPVATMYILRREARAATAAAGKPGTRESVQALVRKELDAALQPEREAKAKATAEARMRDFEHETSSFIEKEFPGITKESPKSFMLFGEIAASLLDRRLSSNDKALASFLKGSAPAVLKEVHAEAKEIFNSAITEFQAWQMKKNNITPNTPGSAGAERPKFSLQDAIDGNENAAKHLPSMRR